MPSAVQKQFQTEEEVEFSWIGKASVIDNRKTIKSHYGSCKIGEDEYKVGDFVFISNFDSVEDAMSSAYMAKILDLYEEAKSSRRSVKEAAVEWYWRQSEIPANILKKQGEVDNQEVYLNTSISMESTIDVETIIGHCQVIRSAVKPESRTANISGRTVQVFFVQSGFDGRKLHSLKDKDISLNKKRVRRQTVAWAFNVEDELYKDTVRPRVTTTPGRRLRGKVRNSEPPDWCADEVNGMAMSPVIPLQGNINKTPLRKTDDLMRDIKLAKSSPHNARLKGDLVASLFMNDAASDLVSDDDSISVLSETSSVSSKNSARSSSRLKNNLSTTRNIEQKENQFTSLKKSKVKPKKRHISSKENDVSNKSDRCSPVKSRKSSDRLSRSCRKAPRKKESNIDVLLKEVKINISKLEPNGLNGKKDLTTSLSRLRTKSASNSPATSRDMVNSYLTRTQNGNSSVASNSPATRSTRRLPTSHNNSPIVMTFSKDGIQTYKSDIKKRNKSLQTAKKVTPLKILKNEENKMYAISSKALQKEKVTPKRPLRESIVEREYSPESFNKSSDEESDEHADLSELSLSDCDSEEFVPSSVVKKKKSLTRRRSTVPQTPKGKKTPLKSATPRMVQRSKPLVSPGNALEEARSRLHVAAVPDTLPCRDKEFSDIYNFVEGKVLDGTGGCMYISGVPGTGKTATVREVMRSLTQAIEDGELQPFTFIEVNGMRLTDPHQAYVQILQQLTNQKVTANHASELLNKRFNSKTARREAVVLLVDELDLLMTKKQDVMYNIFDWPSKPQAKLVVLAVANTMDLPERIMMNRVSSRLGLTRMTFQPYNFKQLQEIVISRMRGLDVFEDDAIQLAARKVAAVSGDARRALDICRRATEIAEMASPSKGGQLVGMAHVDAALKEMFTSPKIVAMRNASLQEQTFLKAIVAEFHRTGVEEGNFSRVFTQHVAICRLEGFVPPSVSEMSSICTKLGSIRLLLLEHGRNDVNMRIRLNVSTDDVLFSLRDTS